MLQFGVQQIKPISFDQWRLSGSVAFVKKKTYV